MTGVQSRRFLPAASTLRSSRVERLHEAIGLTVQSLAPLWWCCSEQTCDRRSACIARRLGYAAAPALPTKSLRRDPRLSTAPHVLHLIPRTAGSVPLPEWTQPACTSVRNVDHGDDAGCVTACTRGWRSLVSRGCRPGPARATRAGSAQLPDVAVRPASKLRVVCRSGGCEGTDRRADVRGRDHPCGRVLVDEVFRGG